MTPSYKYRIGEKVYYFYHKDSTLHHETILEQFDRGTQWLSKPCYRISNFDNLIEESEISRQKHTLLKRLYKEHVWDCTLAKTSYEAHKGWIEDLKNMMDKLGIKYKPENS